MDSDRSPTSSPTTPRRAPRPVRPAIALLGVLAAVAMGVSTSTAAGSPLAARARTTATPTETVFAMDQVQKIVPVDTSTWLSTGDNINSVGVGSAVRCADLSTWLGVTIPAPAGYTRSCSFDLPSVQPITGQSMTVLPQRRPTGTRPQDRFTAHVFYAPPGLDLRHVSSDDDSYQRGLLNLWINDVTAESRTWNPAEMWTSDPLDTVQGGHVSGTLHGHPATVFKTRENRTSVFTVLHAGPDVLSFEMSSGLTPQRAITAAEHVLPS